jgi:hypothetical protein
MANSLSKSDNGVSVSVPAGYNPEQIIGLARAIYIQFFSDHERFCYRVNRDRSKLTVFPVN